MIMIISKSTEACHSQLPPRGILRDEALPVDWQKEEAAHQKRNWVRLTFDCNARCAFCLDAKTHDGTHRDRHEVKRQILDGRRKGAERLILSGGEPTIHPNFVDFVRLGVAAGYHKIQTVTNGRMMAYPAFLRAALDAGLSEITFSIHGPNAQVHDALLGTKGAFEEVTTALRNALADGRPVVNVDVCVNRANVKLLPEMLETFLAMGVREFDLLQVIPFGRAYDEGRETLFYDFDEMLPYLRRAFAHAHRPDVRIWLNRFPPSVLEGFEHLIQDPYKLKDEVRGRKEEYALLLEAGEPLDCRAPGRCRKCYIDPLCSDLDRVRAELAGRRFEVVRIDSEAEASLPPVYGGDPASDQRSRRRLLLPMLGAGPSVDRPDYRPLEELAASAEVRALWIVAPGLEQATRVAARFRGGPPELELELGDYEGFEGALEGADRNSCLGRRLVRVVVRSTEEAERMLAIGADFEVALELSRATAPFFLSLAEVPVRLVAWQPSHGRMSESALHDLELPDFLARLPPAVAVALPIEGLPHCVLGRAPRARPPVLDGAMLDPTGRLEIFRFVERFIPDRFRVKGQGCRRCVHDSDCAGVHVNYVRAHGFSLMRPIAAPAGLDGEG